MARASAGVIVAALNGMDGTGSVNKIGFVSLHTADPGTTGASEYAGVTRQACTWGAAANVSGVGTKTNSSQLTFTTSGATAVQGFGTWDASSSGNYGIGGMLNSNVTAASIVVLAGAISITGG